MKQICGFALMMALSACVPSRRVSDQPPNIIFIVTDDQRWDTLGCYGNEIIHTPNIDALSRRGVTRAAVGACGQALCPYRCRVSRMRSKWWSRWSPFHTHHRSWSPKAFMAKADPQ